MYRGFVYLEIRILVSAKNRAFVIKDNPDRPDQPVCVPDYSALKTAGILSEVFDCRWIKNPAVEKISGLQIPEETDLSGISLKVAENGILPINFHGHHKEIGIEEMRIEEDAGRLTHSGNNTRMDYTDAGCASIRIKTSSSIELGEEAYAFLDELFRILQYLELVSMPSDNTVRCNAYVALAPYPEHPASFVKLRNLNSFNFVRKAVNAELSRQEEILACGGSIQKESRLWLERQNITKTFRTHSGDEVPRFVKTDYLYEAPQSGQVSDREAVPETGTEPVQDSFLGLEMPSERRLRFQKQYGLSSSATDYLCEQKRRADFFEETVALGASPLDTAHWMCGKLLRPSKKNGADQYSAGSDSLWKLKPEDFARILILFSEHKIHSGIVRQMIEDLLNGKKSEEEDSWEQKPAMLTKEQVEPIIAEVIAENPLEKAKLQSGDMAPMEFLTGLVMKRSNGLANPQQVKCLIKASLNISIVYILAMGGAMVSSRRKDGIVENDPLVMKKLLSVIPKEIKHQLTTLNTGMSEELEPADWAALITGITERLSEGTANGIVVTMGTDTLPYTAALLYWLFSDAECPVVITASHSIPKESDEASESFLLAVQTACNKKNGVYVVVQNRILSPLNLKFTGSAPGDTGFTNWNLPEPLFTGSGPIAVQMTGQKDTDAFVVRQILKETNNSLLALKTYPGLKSELFLPLLDRGISRIILELYNTGTGNMRDSDYSLKTLLMRGKRHNCRFYCTSQQQNTVDFSSYSTANMFWKSGAVPMGILATESVIALIYAASLICDTAEEFDRTMDTYAALYRFAPDNL